MYLSKLLGYDYTIEYRLGASNVPVSNHPVRGRLVILFVSSKFFLLGPITTIPAFISGLFDFVAKHLPIP